MIDKFLVMMTGQAIRDIAHIAIRCAQAIAQVSLIHFARVIDSKSPVDMLSGFAATSLLEVSLEVLGASLNHAGDLFLSTTVSANS